MAAIIRSSRVGVKNPYATAAFAAALIHTVNPQLPQGTEHRVLHQYGLQLRRFGTSNPGRFTPPPQSVCGAPPVRIFVGQLPANIDEDGIAEVIYQACSVVVLDVDIIHTWGPKARGLHCAHAVVRAEDVDAVLAASKRALVDATGMWIANTRDEFEILHTYCSVPVNNNNNANAAQAGTLPQHPVVFEIAKSTFQTKRTRRPFRFPVACH